MILLLAGSAAARSVTVCPVGCDSNNLEAAILDLSDETGPHQITVSGAQALTSTHALARDYTITGTPGAELIMSGSGRLIVNTGRSLTVSGFAVGFLSGWSGKLFDVNGHLDLVDLSFGAVVVDIDGALVHLNSGGDAVLTGVDIAPAPFTSTDFLSKSAFRVNSGATLSLAGSTFESVQFSSGHLFDVNGGTVVATDLTVTTASSSNRGVLGRIASNGSLTIEGGVLGGNLALSLIASGDGGLFRVEGAQLTMSGVSIQGLVAGNGGVAWANGASTLLLDHVDVTDVLVGADGGLIEQSGGSMTWNGGVVSNVTTTGSGGAFHLTGGVHAIDGVQFSGLVGLNGPALAETSAPLTLHAVTVTSPTSLDAAVHSTSDLVVDSSTFTGGWGTEAGHLWIEGNAALEVQNSIFSGGDCTTTMGAAAVLIEGGRIGTITGTIFQDNGSPFSSCRGALFVDGELRLSNTSFLANQTIGVGAVELANGAALLQGAEPNFFIDNVGADAAVHGSTDAMFGALAEPFRAVFESNLGGALRFEQNSLVYLADSDFRLNDAEGSAGGAIRTGTNASLIVEDSNFTTNRTTGNRGGAIAAEGGALLEVRGTNFVGNTAQTAGGALYTDVDGATVEACSFEGNSTVTGVGGAVAFGASLEVVDSTFHTNIAGSYGGAISGEASSELVLMNSELRVNEGTNGGVYLAADSALTSLDNVFAQNVGLENRGAVLVNSGGSMHVERTLFCGNSSLGPGSALFGNSNTTASVRHSWFVEYSTAPIFLASLEAGAMLTQDTFWGPGTAIRITDGTGNIDVDVSRSLFGGFSASDRPVEITGLDSPDAVSFTDSMLDPTHYLLPSDVRVTVSNLIDDAPELVNPTVDCATATYRDFAAGPLSPAWTRVDEDDHWGAYLPVWGENVDDDASPALWDCVDGDFDDDPTFHREALDVCGDGLDQDCDGVADDGCVTLYYPDQDMDGYGDAQHPGSETPQAGWVTDHTDCDDGEDTIRPDAVEVCNTVDDNCDNQIDEGFVYEAVVVDEDGDLHGVDGMGCPGTTLALPADDCDDTNAAINPDAAEVCGNVVDENCSGEIDETRTWFADLDGDGFGDPVSSMESCDPPADHVLDDTDCDDQVATINPAGTEICNGVDDDCVGGPDDGLQQLTSYLDADGDGYALDIATPVMDCLIPSGNTLVRGDCNDDDATTYTGAQELCDSVDHDCDGDVNPVGTPTWYTDADGDGYGAGVGIEVCDPPSGTVGNATDCDDQVFEVNPDAHEVCDGIDNDCSGTADDGLPAQMWYVDSDGDGYGTGAPTTSCDGLQDPARVSENGDCNDQNPQLSPGEQEVCDQIDNDCDGNVDDQDDDVVDGVIYYLNDVDGDGWGQITAGPSCNIPPNALYFGPDCDDGNDLIYPAAPENCVDLLDNDCDGLVDAADPDFIDGAQIYWPDADGDGYGDANNPYPSCGLVTGYVLGGLLDPDCDDALFAVNPTATEICDGMDNDCDGDVDGEDTNPPPSDGTLLYTDADGDGYGAGLLLVRTCDPAQPLPTTSITSGDCDDTDDGVHPDAVEDCSPVDRDCSGDAYDSQDAYYADADGDGFGDPLIEEVGCPGEDPAWTDNGEDCDDTTDTVHPGAAELCDEVDQDCDGLTWQGEDLIWQVDRDCDGVLGALESACDPADLLGLGTCDPVVHDGSDPVFDCDDQDPEVQECSSTPEPKEVLQTGCGCNAGGSGGWMGLLVLLYGMRKRRSGRERLVG